MKILAIDDKRDNLTALKAVLTDCLPEARLLTALGGPQGVELARVEDPDVILLDIVMPDMDGYEVCRTLKADERLRSIPVLFLTALRTDREFRLKALEAGAEGFLSKPIDEVELTVQVRAMTKIKAANRMQRLEKEELAALVAERTRDLEQELEARKRAEESLRKSEATVRNKLKAIVEPDDDIGTLELADIVDTEALQSIMEEFHRATGMLGALLDLSGRVLVAVGWQEICTKFHRCHPDTLKNCVESDTILTRGVPPGTFKAYRCKNNMWDMVTPLMLGDRHVGNVFIGQFFYDDETPDMALFREQARRHGFDEAEYLASLARVPRFSRETAHAGIQFYAKLTGIVSRLSFSAIQQSRMLADRKRAEAERESLQTQLNHAQKMEAIGRLAGGVAHDFNNMLGVIIGNAELALEAATPADPTAGPLQEILKAALRSSGITRQLLAFARKQISCPVVLDLNETVSGTLLLIRQLIGENITLTWSPGPETGRVRIDPAQIDQILANLAVNARDAIDDTGRLAIRTANVTIDDEFCGIGADARSRGDFAPGDFVMLEVGDTGRGMTRAALDHAFEPFFTTKEVGKGTGLGLATVYGIVQQNGGRIDVTSEPSMGTTFRIYLPRVTGEPAATAGPVEEHPARGTETVLLVEDEAPILEMCRTFLERKGYRVLPATAPGEALAWLERHPEPIHLLLTDVVMPEMSGRALRDRILLLRPGIKVLFMSGYTADTIAHHGVLDDGVDFIQKPFSLRTLALKAREVLDRE